MSHFEINEQTEFILYPESELEIAKLLCAFSNSKGGKLLIGVRKNGKIAGTEPSESFSIVSSAASGCFPPIDFDSEIVQYAHKIVLEITVPESKEIHKVLINNECISYIRFKDLSLVTNSVLKKYLELKNKTISFSEELNSFLSIFHSSDFLTLTQISKTVDLKREKIELLLAQLLVLNKIEASLKEDAIVYQAPKEV